MDWYTYKNWSTKPSFIKTYLVPQVLGSPFHNLSERSSSDTMPTALASPTAAQHDSSSHLSLIVQTNLQVCAYTSSDLYIAMLLLLFCDDDTGRRLPNAVFMELSRASVKTAIRNGIQAKYIIQFLENHLHPKLREHHLSSSSLRTISPISPIPISVLQQLFLWEREVHLGSLRHGARMQLFPIINLGPQ